MLAITAQPLEEHIGNRWFLLFPVGIVFLYFLSRRRELPGIVNEKIGYAKISTRRAYETVITVVGIIILIAGPVLASRDYEDVGNFADQISLPTVPGCVGPMEWRLAWRPIVDQADGVWLGSYECGVSMVSVYVGGYVDIAQGRELVGQSNQLFPASWRRFSAKSTEQIQLGQIGNLVVNEVDYKHPEKRLVSWYWYSVGGRPMTSRISVKFFQGWQALTGESRHAFVSILVVSGNTGVKEKRELLRQFSTALIARNGNQLGYADERNH